MFAALVWPSSPQAVLRVPTACFMRATFDETLRGVLLEADSVGAVAAVRKWLDQMDKTFIPTLVEHIDATSSADEVSPMIAIMEAIDHIYSPPPFAASEISAQEFMSHWRRSDGIVEEEEEEAVDLYDLIPGASRPEVGQRPSAYGEVTYAGARGLFAAMGLQARGRPASFMDLGSGAGRLVAQAWLELPDLQRAIGVELAPTRHAAAMRAWERLEAAPQTASREGSPEFWLGSMLEADLSCATHVYVASLCMGDSLLDQLWSRLLTQAPTLEVVASLREFRTAKVPPDDKVEVEMTWTPKGGRGSPVFIYRMRT